MKYFLPLILLMLAVVSCSKSSEPNLLGTWSFERVSINGIEFPYQHASQCQKDYFKFSIQNKTLKVYETFKTEACDDCEACPTIGTIREWTQTGDTVNLYLDKPTPSLQFVILSIEGDTLKYTYEADYNSDGTIDQVEITAHRYTLD